METRAENDMPGTEAAESLTDYSFSTYGIQIWKMTQAEDYNEKGSPEPGDRVPQKWVDAMAEKGQSIEGLLAAGFLWPPAITDRTALLNSEYVYTAFGVSQWETQDPVGHKHFGAPKAGDPASVPEVEMHAKVVGGDPGKLLIVGMMARPGATHIHTVCKVKTDLNEWTELTKEEPQEPLWPTIDPHHHLWLREQPEGTALPPFMKHSFGCRQPGYAYPYSELAKDYAGNAVVGSVFVECGAEYTPGWPMPDPLTSLPESKWVQDIAEKSPQPMGIVGHLDLTQGRESVASGLRAHKEAAPNLVGIRHSLAWHKDGCIFSRHLEGQAEEVSKKEAFREGMEVLAEMGLTYDAWLFQVNLAELTELARACPRTRIICDHVGGPLGSADAGFSRSEGMPAWRAAITELSTCPNVVVKLSGLSMPVAGFAYDVLDKPPTSRQMADDYKPYFEHCLNAFGPDRCFFASNFPVDKVSASFTTHWNAFKLLAAELLPGNEAAQRALFYDNIVRTYGLDKPPFNMPSTSKDAESLPKY